LRALAENDAISIANLLEEIFASFGPPRVLHTNIGSAFENQHVYALCTEWNVELVHKRFRKSSKQGSMERAKRDIENIIMNWERFFQRNDWANNLKMFQLIKNNRF
jgi:transposase InsO family protein